MASFKPFLQAFIKLIAAGIVQARPSKLVTVTPAQLQCPGDKLKEIAAEVFRARDGKHLVIMRIKITLQCACGKVQSLVHLHQGRVFDSLIAAETYRSSIVRRTGNEARLISSAKVCSEFSAIAQNQSVVARIAEARFLHDQFDKAPKPETHFGVTTCWS